MVTVALPGTYGKPRPALVVQADKFSDLYSLTVLPLTTEVLDAPFFRIGVLPSDDNGLRAPSQIMVDKASTIPRDKVSGPIGTLGLAELLAVDRALALFLGLA